MTNSIQVHLLRVLVLLASVLGSWDPTWRLVGAWSGSRHRLRSVLLCYAASAEHARRYCYPWAEQWLRPRPTPIGVFRQQGQWGLILASPATEPEVLHRSDRTLASLLARLARIAELAGVQDIRLAGFLPTHVRRIGHPLQTNESAEAVADLVTAAALEAARRASLEPDAPVVVVGGKGSVGSLVSQRLRSIDRAFVAIDVLRPSRALLPESPSIFVDVSGSELLAAYADDVQSGSVVVSELYPEPPRRVVRRLKERGCRVFHVVGVSATVVPALPGAYAGAIPCCGMLAPAEPGAIVLREL